jgi:hypothetical protein
VVSRPALAQSFDELISFSAWAESLGRVPGARTLEFSIDTYRGDYSAIAIHNRAALPRAGVGLALVS